MLSVVALGRIVDNHQFCVSNCHHLLQIQILLIETEVQCFFIQSK